MARGACVVAAGLVCAITLVACAGKSEPVANPPAVVSGEGGSDTSAPPATGTCVLADDRCTGNPLCCPPVGAFRVDFERGCRAAKETAFRCDPPRASATRNAGYAQESSCLSRDVDAGADGGEYYYSPCYVTQPGFTACDGELYGKAMALSSTVCR